MPASRWGQAQRRHWSSLPLFSMDDRDLYREVIRPRLEDVWEFGKPMG